VRGIPRTDDAEDSTDLEDSSDEEKHVTKQLAQSQLKVPTPDSNESVPGSLPASPATEKRRGLFGRLRSKKGKDEGAQSRLGVGTIAERNAILERTAPAVQAAKENEHVPTATEKPADEKSKRSQLGFGSIAERDAVIEQTRAKLEGAKEQRPTSPTSGGKLHRRQLPPRMMSDSWPLPPQLPASVDRRPNTSDGIGAGKQPPAAGGVGNSGTGVDGQAAAYSRTGKKKRFPMLRKAFGLKD